MFILQLLSFALPLLYMWGNVAMGLMYLVIALRFPAFRLAGILLVAAHAITFVLCGFLFLKGLHPQARDASLFDLVSHALELVGMGLYLVGYYLIFVTAVRVFGGAKA